MVVMLEALVILLLVAGVYFVGKLVQTVVVGRRAVAKATAHADAQLKATVDSLSTESLRTRLLDHSYFADDLRRQPSIQLFLSRVSKGDEVSLSVEYPRGRLYRLFADAEQVAGRTAARPEATDVIGELSLMLQELARRTR
jgi:hypothetical protein